MVAYALLLGMMWAIMAGMVTELLTSWKEHLQKFGSLFIHLCINVGHLERRIPTRLRVVSYFC